MKFSKLFFSLAMSAGVLISTSSFAQTGPAASRPLPVEPTMKHHHKVNTAAKTHEINHDAGCAKVAPSCDMPKSAKPHKNKKPKHAHKHAHKPVAKGAHKHAVRFEHTKQGHHMRSVAFAKKFDMHQKHHVHSTRG